MGASEWGKPPNALRAKGVEKEEEQEQEQEQEPPLPHRLRRTPSHLPNGQESEAGHSPVCSTEVKNNRSYISIPPYEFMARCMMKHKVFRKMFSSKLHEMNW
jgi:hypothetical protein